jgi:hypothetical protein
MQTEQLCFPVKQAALEHTVVYLFKTWRMVQLGSRKRKNKISQVSHSDLIVLRKKSTLQIKHNN